MPRTDGKTSNGKTGEGPRGNTLFEMSKDDPGLLPRKPDTVYGIKPEKPEKPTDEVDDDETNG